MTLMFVREAMSRRVATVGRATSLASATRLMQEQDLLAVAVVRARAPVKVLTRATLSRSVPGAASSRLRAGDEEGQPFVLLAPDELLSSVVDTLREADTVGLVIEHTDVVGVLTATMLPSDSAGHLHRPRGRRVGARRR